VSKGERRVYEARMARTDPHSFADAAQGRTRSFDWRARVDFAAKLLHAEVTLELEQPARGGAFDLDSRDLAIEAVTDAKGAALPWTLHPAAPILGARLEVQLPAGAKALRVVYRTSPDASALQWLEPAQTLGGRHPYLFSQCQAIHARSVLPCQDTPGVRQRYTAALTVPRELTAVMAAASKGPGDSAGQTATFRFEMPQPIPPYLFAFAVGDLASKDLSPRSRVWAEPGQLAAAAAEFSGVEAQLKAAEALFGPYDWERFDLLVMPPSFPFGGMENPRLTFLTPTLLTGDQSLVNVVAHELAHSWTGNLVTNANFEHFWLNEGFTVFAERRILEALEGADAAGLHAAVGFKSLEESLSRFKDQPNLTKLRQKLDGVDPDEAFSQVPYEKGYLFLKALEAAAGRGPFDAMLKKWLATHRFGAATTDDFLAHVRAELPALLKQVEVTRWLDEPGLPPGFPRPVSKRLESVQQVGARAPTADEVKPWTATEWQLYLESLPHPSPAALCEALEKAYALTAAKNPEVLVAWLVLACESGFAPALPRAERFLGEVGRMKYLRPLYKALTSRRETRAKAREVFERFRPRYHPIAQQVVAALLKKEGA